ncbi:MAG: oxidoreductase [Anaerolineales bacterium]
MAKWRANDMPDQTGKTILITGGNSGLGYESALAFARKNAQVIIASRNTAKAEAAQTNIRAEIPQADVQIMHLDLADLDGVAAFAETFRGEFERLDVLMNNAGIMALPYRQSPQGYELQFAVNHLGHFALTGRLLPLLLTTPGSRVVTVSSLYHTMGDIHFDDLQAEKRYERWGRYGQSKLANVLFAKELDRRLRAAEADTLSLAVHPGYVATNLQPGMAQETGNLVDKTVVSVANTLIAGRVEMGVLPQLYAATMPDAQGGQFWGPRFFGVRGGPGAQDPSKRAQDPDLARRLWEISAELTGVHYDALSDQQARSSA